MMDYPECLYIVEAENEAGIKWSYVTPDSNKMRTYCDELYKDGIKYHAEVIGVRGNEPAENVEKNTDVCGSRLHIPNPFRPDIYLFCDNPASHVHPGGIRHSTRVDGRLTTWEWSLAERTVLGGEKFNYDDT